MVEELEDEPDFVDPLSPEELEVLDEPEELDESAELEEDELLDEGDLLELDLPESERASLR